MMGSSMVRKLDYDLLTSRVHISLSQVLAASRQTFAFSRDGALPLSGWLYRMNGYTKTPVNTVRPLGSISTRVSLIVTVIG